MSDVILLTRQDLYDRVWSTPMMRIATDLGVSSTRLRAACEEMGVPRPRQGHWTLAHLGRVPRQPRLPALPKGKVEEVRVWSANGPRRPAPRAEGVVIPEQPAVLEHPLITRTRACLLSGKVDERNIVTAKGPCLAIRTSPVLIERALVMFAGVLQGASANGWEVNVEPRLRTRDDYQISWTWQLSHATTVRIGGVRLELSLEERVTKARRPATAFERANGRAMIGHDHVDEYLPTGELVFAVRGDERTGARQKWADGRKRLESRLPEIVQGIASAQLSQVRAQEDARLEAIRREEERRRWEEEEFRRRQAAIRAAELQRQTEALVALADRHERAERVRRMVAAARAQSSEVEPWAIWAEGLANALDPLSNLGALVVPAGGAGRR